HGAAVHEGAAPAVRAPQAARRRDLPDVSEVLSEELPLEVRLDEDGRGAPEFHDEERLQPVLRRELLGNGDAEGLRKRSPSPPAGGRGLGRGGTFVYA